VDDALHLPRAGVSNKVVIIGSSTGGPQALIDIFRSLPADLPIPVVVAQHMLPKFIAPFVNSVNKAVELPAYQGSEGLAIQPGGIYISPADSNMKLLRMPDGGVRVSIVPATMLLKPSVDILMTSAAAVYGEGCLGIILTGMGKDGLEGMRAIKASGGSTIIQDKSSSVVYGMAQAVFDEHLADKVLPLPSIASAIIEWSEQS
jgi:two-component system chemotaxis response regulator CheB